MEKIRWGILGCGKIAHKFASDLRLVEDATLAAVASREKDRAEAFAKQHNAALALTSYEALASCDQVDVIYVATPHGFHHEHTLLCLNHKKAVLCEKAFALNERQASEMVNAAKKNNVFLMASHMMQYAVTGQAAKPMPSRISAWGVYDVFTVADVFILNPID